jgi:hypothetical protein
VLLQVAQVLKTKTPAGGEDATHLRERRRLVGKEHHSELTGHDIELAGTPARGVPAGPPQFFAGVPHGYAGVDVIRADLRAAGLQSVDLALVSRVGSSPQAADLAAGYCTGTPVRGAIEARGDLQGRRRSSLPGHA